MRQLDYIQAAENIFDWLEKYQVLQKRIAAKRINNTLSFKLIHPVEGNIDVTEVFPKRKSLQSHSIGMEMLENSNTDIVLNVYDAGGIYDPLDKNIPGDHYAATHFALLGAILFSHNKDESILEKVKQAAAFHFRTSKDEYRFGTWYYHWDFQNYAMLECYRLIGETLSKSEQNQWEADLKKSKQNTDNPLTNWVAMRAYASLLRNGMFGSKIEKLKYQWRMKRIEKARHDDGCYDDEFNQSRPIQYHVFTLALLHRIYLLDKNPQIRKKFLEGINFFLKFIDPDGCYNYLGRGQEQIFGYGAGLYVLEAAKLLDKKNAAIYQYNRDLMWNHLLSFQNDEVFPLVLNSRNDEEKFGWYDYHHKTVYLAFLGVWLGLAHLLNTPKAAYFKEKAKESNRYFQHFKPTKNVIISRDEYFLSLSAGTPEYLSEPGLSPNHLWLKDVGYIFSCPGGPSPKTFGKENQIQNVEMNFFAPIARNLHSKWMVPANREGKIIAAFEERLEVHFEYPDFSVTRKIELNENDMIFLDNFIFFKSEMLAEIRYFNFPVIIDKFEIAFNQTKLIELKSGKGNVNLEILETDFTQKKFESLEKIKTAKGLAQTIVLRELNFEPQANLQKYIRFSLKRK